MTIKFAYNEKSGESFLLIYFVGNIDKAAIKCYNKIITSNCFIIVIRFCLRDSFGGENMRLPICLSIAAVILLVDAVMAFKALRKGTLFSNIIKSGISFGLPALLAGGIALFGLIGVGGKKSASNPGNSNSGWESSGSITDNSPIGSTPDESSPDESYPNESYPDESSPSIPSHEHEYSQTVTQPTCTLQGYTTYSCYCGDWYNDDYVKETGHSHEVKYVVEPTCTQKGYTVYTCACGDTYNGNYVKETEHTYEVDSVIEPTCLAGGYTVYACYCGATKKDDYTPKAEHDYDVEAVIEPTCTQQGYTIYACECGDTYNDNYTDTIPHDYDVEAVIEPTCTAEGYTIYTCACGDTYNDNYTNTIPHDYGTTVIEPTCTAQGYTLYSCDCGASYKGDYTNTIPHDYGTTVIEPTCTAEGYTIYLCECGATYNGDYVGVIPHTYDKETVVEPTCKDQGYTIHSCVCGASYEDSYVDPTGKHVAGVDGLCKYCKITIQTSGLSYTVSSDGTYATVTGYKGASKEVVIASTYNGVPVTNIGANAFQESTLTSVVIPNSVTTIETYAFLNCYKLTSVVIPKSVTSIARGAFYSCENLLDVTMLVGAATIESTAFYNCPKVTNVYIESVADWCKIKFKSEDANPLAVRDSTSDHVFKNLYVSGELVTELIIPQGVTSIGDYAFYNCENLTRVEIASSVTSIGRYAFQGCTSLSSLVFKDTTTWYRTSSLADWSAQTGGTKTAVSYAYNAATYFTSTYKEYYWYKL